MRLEPWGFRSVFPCLILSDQTDLLKWHGSTCRCKFDGYVGRAWKIQDFYLAQLNPRFQEVEYLWWLLDNWLNVYRMRAIITAPYLFKTHFLNAKNFYLKFFFHKILALFTIIISIEQRFIIKSRLWCRVYCAQRISYHKSWNCSTIANVLTQALDLQFSMYFDTDLLGKTSSKTKWKPKCTWGCKGQKCGPRPK